MISGKKKDSLKPTLCMTPKKRSFLGILYTMEIILLKMNSIWLC